MNILYLAAIRLPTEKAHGVQIMKTCEALTDAGVDVELVIPGRKTPIAQDAFSYYAVKNNFTVTALGTPDLIGWGKLGFLISALWFSEAAKWRGAFWDADIIYSRDALVLLQYLLLGRHLVYEAHRSPSFFDRVVARRAYRVIVITESLKRAFVAAGVDEKKIAVAHDAVDAPPPPRTRAELSLPAGPLAVYAGSRGAGKGVEVLLKAVGLLPGVSVHLVSGETPAEARATLALADVVVVPNSAKHVASAVFTSPMKLFEALASGARVVASGVPAIREIAGDDAVWFFKPDDPADLARAIREALADTRASEKIARARALAQKYSWKARAERIVSACGSPI